MPNYVRRLVSGNKARFKDEELDLDLDLVYVTDQLIVMGFPAVGLEGFYRNKREDAKKFLDHRHRSNYWIFNLCPLAENSYDATAFDGRVSRYPFPDHHPPPLAILALAAREIRSWLDGFHDRVAVLHCKAGKGRSGTVACAYLLSLGISPEPPRLQRSYPAKQWAKLRAEALMDDVVEIEDPPNDEGLLNPEARSVSGAGIELDSPSSGSTFDIPSVTSTPALDTPILDAKTPTAVPAGSHLDKVLTLHASRRMKSPSQSSSSLPNPSPHTLKQGVSIPSQRRFLFYWSLFLSRTAPAHFWPHTPKSGSARPKVKVLQITVRLREAGSTGMTVVKAINKMLDKANTPKGRSDMCGQDIGSMWVSLARYDDDFVEALESWENRTRDEQGRLCTRQKHGGPKHGDDAGQIFENGRWDKGKMIRSFARLGRLERKIIEHVNEKSRIYAHVLTPLNQNRWIVIQKSSKTNPNQGTPDIPPVLAEENNDEPLDTVEVILPDDGIILDAAREVRAKLYLGKIPMGWFWFIPTFHMPQPPPRTSDEISPPTHLCLTRKEVDFPLGVGVWIVDINIEMTWMPSGGGSSSEFPLPPETGTDSG